MAHVDQVRGVLTWRIAQRLLSQNKRLLGHPDVTLERAKPNERDFYLGLAREVLEIADRIERTDPPTAGEINRYESAKALLLAQQRARLEAAQRQHRLGSFRPTADRVSVSTSCERCSAGVSIALGTAAISASEPLTRTCIPLGGSDVRW